MSDDARNGSPRAEVFTGAGHDLQLAAWPWIFLSRLEVRSQARRLWVLQRLERVFASAPTRSARGSWSVNNSRLDRWRLPNEITRWYMQNLEPEIFAMKSLRASLAGPSS